MVYCCQKKASNGATTSTDVLANGVVEAAVVVEREMNFDEAKVRPYALEDPLVHADGRKVTRETWPERRRELLDILDRELFGREPPPPKALEVVLQTNEVTQAGFAVRRGYRMWFTPNRTGPCVDWTVWLPNRPPSVIRLREGWNHVKLTLPKPKTDFEGQKWLGTFVPISGTTEHPCEIPGLCYSSGLVAVSGAKML